MTTLAPDTCPVVPVVVLDDPAHAEPLARALLAGGITSIEVTLRTAAGLDAIKILATDVPEIQTGAGSVVTPDQVDQVHDAGATFFVSPGLSPAVVERARDRGIAVLPGIATATEGMAAVALGIDTVKFFPAQVLGGPAAIRAVAAPLPSLRFVPTGGITEANAADYLALPMVRAIGGSWMVERPLVVAQDWAEITRRSAAATALAATTLAATAQGR